MNLTLFTGPSRSSNLSELFRRIPLGDGRICAVAPDTRSATALQRRIASITGGAVLGTRVFTFDLLASSILSLDGPPPESISHHLKRALIREIVKSRIGPTSRWHRVASYPGFADLVQSFLEDIRSGQGGEVHDPGISAVVRAYESHLSRLGLTDHEGFVRLALAGDAPERFARAFRGTLVVDGFYDLTPNQFDLIARLTESFRRSTVSIADDPGRPGVFSLSAALIDRFREIGAKTVEVPFKQSSPAGRAAAAFGRTDGNVFQGETSTDPVEIHLFSSERSEADWIAGTIRGLVTGGECRGEDIMVVSRQIPKEESPLYRALIRHGVPVETGASGELAAQPLVRFILDALDCSLDPCEERFARVERSAYVSSPQLSGADVSLFDRRGWSSMIADPDTPDGYAGSTRRMIEALGISGKLESRRDDPDFYRDRAVCETVLKHLKEFADFYEPLRPMMGAKEFRQTLARFFGDATVPAAGAARGVLLAGVTHARYAERPVVFLTGLTRDSFPMRHDRFSLHDPETANMLADRKEREEPLLFYMAMSGAEKLFLSYPGVDDEGGSDGMSPYLRDILDYTGVTPIPHTGIPGAAWEGGFTTERGRLEMAVGTLLNAGPDAEGLMRIIGEHSPGRVQLLKNAFCRNGDAERRDGFTLADPDSLARLEETWGSERLVSVTALERYRDCPTGFFFGSIMGLDPPRAPADGLDGLERGSIIHDILAAFYSERAAAGTARFTPGELADAETMMDGAVDGVFDSWRRNLARLRPVVFNAERRLVKRWMAAFVRLEAQAHADTPFVPSLFEASFGSGGVLPLVIERDGDIVRLRGRIDRIDLTSGETSRARVVDYKTGGKTTRSDIEAGRALQLPLYLQAARTVVVPGADVSGGMYYHLREAEYDADKHALTGCTVIGGDDDEIIENADRYAIEAAGGIRSGRFPPPEKCSRYCDWKPLCRGGCTREEDRDDADR